MDPWGWIFLGVSFLVAGLSLWTNRPAAFASMILVGSCVASNLRHVYLNDLPPEAVYALIDLCAGLLMIEVFRRAERGRRRWLTGILALFSAMMGLHLAIWLTRQFQPVQDYIWLYRLALSVLFGFQLVLAAIPGGLLAYRHLRTALRRGLRARALQA